jgi:hypothetical protein
MSFLQRGKFKIEDNYIKRVLKKREKRDEEIANQLEQGR